MNRNNKDVVNQAKRWLSSSKGQDSLKRSILEAIEISERFNKSRQIDPKILKETFTI